MAKRTDRASKRRQRQLRQRWYIGGTVAIVTLVIVGLAYVYITRDQPGEEFSDQGNRHVAAAPDDYIWNSRPPTSGSHANQIAPWGEHDESVQEWYQVHNLEDGGVILHYNCPDGCDEDVAALQDIMNDVGQDRLILHPYTNMDSKIAVTAWTRLLALDEVDRDQIVDFIEAYRGIDHH